MRVSFLISLCSPFLPAIIGHSGDSKEGLHSTFHLHEDNQSKNIKTLGISVSPPPFSDKAATARWIAHNTDWCSIATIDSRERKGAPFGNIASFSDGTRHNSTGTIYMLHSSLDASMIDLKENNQLSMAISEMQTGYCNEQTYDPEDPRCARLTIGGSLVDVMGTAEKEVAKEAMFDRHPSMKQWYSEDDALSHDFRFYKLDIEEIWMVDYFGGPAIIDIDAWNRGTDEKDAFLSPGYTQVEKNIMKEISPYPSFFQAILNAFLVVCFGILGYVKGRNSTENRDDLSGNYHLIR